MTNERLYELTSEIIQTRHKILDEFAKAYLAETMHDVQIRNLVLNEQQVVPTEKYGVFGYKYWFEVKNSLTWKKFSEETPDFEWVWVSDYTMVELYSLAEMPFGDPPWSVWAEAHIPYPSIPKSPLHMCFRTSAISQWLFKCYEKLDGKLMLCYANDEEIEVKTCPFCGYKVDYNDK